MYKRRNRGGSRVNNFGCWGTFLKAAPILWRRLLDNIVFSRQRDIVHSIKLFLFFLDFQMEMFGLHAHNKQNVTNLFLITLNIENYTHKK